jgi:diadenosine tetraphosphate (Ap4A) HIT family hydrolase
MKVEAEANWRFCLSNSMLIDKPLHENRSFFVLGSVEPERPHATIIVPHRHLTTPFDLAPKEWADIAEVMAFSKSHLLQSKPCGFTLGWNVGEVAGQEIFHAHMHVIARFEDEKSEGLGIHALFRSSKRTTEV